MGVIEIYYNYISANRQANELDNIARKLKYSAEKYLINKQTNLDRNWDGDASVVFFNKESSIGNKMLTESASLREVANSIRGIAKRTYEAEMKALELAEKRSFR